MGYQRYTMRDIGRDLTIFVNGQYANEHDELLIEYVYNQLEYYDQFEITGDVYLIGVLYNDTKKGVDIKIKFITPECTLTVLSNVSTKDRELFILGDDLNWSADTLSGVVRESAYKTYGSSLSREMLSYLDYGMWSNVAVLTKEAKFDAEFDESFVRDSAYQLFCDTLKWDFEQMIERDIVSVELVIDENDHLNSAEYIYHGSRGDYMVFNVSVAEGSFEGRDAVCDVTYINALFVM